MKSDEKTAELFPDSQAFPRSELGFNCRILVSCGYSSAFMYESDSIYIFDSHSRDANGLPAVDGTSVLLKFNPREVAGSYIKSIYLDHFCNPSVYYQMQYFNQTISKPCLVVLKSHFHNLQQCQRKRNQRDGLTESEKSDINSNRRQKYINNRVTLNCEKREKHKLYKEAVNQVRREKHILYREAANQVRREKHTLCKKAVNKNRREKYMLVKEAANKARRGNRRSATESEKEAINVARKKHRKK